MPPGEVIWHPSNFGRSRYRFLADEFFLFYNCWFIFVWTEKRQCVISIKIHRQSIDWCAARWSDMTFVKFREVTVSILGWWKFLFYKCWFLFVCTEKQCFILIKIHRHPSDWCAARWSDMTFVKFQGVTLSSLLQLNIFLVMFNIECLLLTMVSYLMLCSS